MTHEASQSLELTSIAAMVVIVLILFQLSFSLLFDIRDSATYLWSMLT